MADDQLRAQRCCECWRETAMSTEPTSHSIEFDGMSDTATAHAIATLNRLYREHPHNMTMGELLRQAIVETVPLIREQVIAGLITHAENYVDIFENEISDRSFPPSDDRSFTRSVEDWLRAHLSQSSRPNASEG